MRRARGASTSPSRTTARRTERRRADHYVAAPHIRANFRYGPRNGHAGWELRALSSVCPSEDRPANYAIIADPIISPCVGKETELKLF